MAFTVGELVAKLRMDTAQFDQAVARTTDGLQKVDTTVKRAATSFRSQANATRLSTQEVRDAEREWNKLYGEVDKAAASIQRMEQRMGRLHSAGLAADAQRTRSMGLMHSEALAMNAVIDAGGESARRATPGFGRLTNVVQTLAIQATGVNPLMGRLGSTLGMFAFGSVLMTGVLAGLAAVAVAWRKIGEDARIAEERLADAVARIRERGEAERVAAMGGEAAADQLEVAKELQRVLREQAEARERLTRAEAGVAAAAGAPGREGVDPQLAALAELQRAKEDLQALEREGLRLGFLVSQAGLQAADTVKKEASGWDKLTEALRRYNRERNKKLLADMNATSTFRDVGNGISSGSVASWQQRQANIARGSGLRYTPPTQTFDPNDHGVSYIKRTIDELDVQLNRFGEGVKAVGESFIDMGALGANLAGQGIGMAIGMLGDALFGPKYVSALEENTRALRRMSGDTSELEKAIESLEDTGFDDFADQLRDTLARMNLDTQLNLARRSMEAQDITDPAGQFAQLRAVLAGSGADSSLTQGLTLENVGDRLTQILGSISAGTFNPALLGRISLDEFLDIFGEMESLGDAAGDAAGELAGLASVVRNAPSGYRANFARYGAETPTDMGGKPDKGITVEGDIIIVTDDPDKMGEKIRRQAQRGGTSAFQLATRPSGSFTRGAV